MHDAKNGIKSRQVSQKIISYDHQDRLEDNEDLLGEWEADADYFLFQKAWKGKLYNR